MLPTVCSPIQLFPLCKIIGIASQSLGEQKARCALFPGSLPHCRVLWKSEGEPDCIVVTFWPLKPSGEVFVLRRIQTSE